MGHQNSGHFGQNGIFGLFGNGHRRHQHGHTGCPVKEHNKTSSVVLDSYQSDLPFYNEK